MGSLPWLKVQTPEHVSPFLLHGGGSDSEVMRRSDQPAFIRVLEIWLQLSATSVPIIINEMSTSQTCHRYTTNSSKPWISHEKRCTPDRIVGKKRSLHFSLFISAGRFSPPQQLIDARVSASEPASRLTMFLCGAFLIGSTNLGPPQFRPCMKPRLVPRRRYEKRPRLRVRRQISGIVWERNQYTRRHYKRHDNAEKSNDKRRLD